MPRRIGLFFRRERVNRSQSVDMDRYVLEVCRDLIEKMFDINLFQPETLETNVDSSTNNRDLLHESFISATEYQKNLRRSDLEHFNHRTNELLEHIRILTDDNSSLKHDIEQAKAKLEKEKFEKEKLLQELRNVQYHIEKTINDCK